MIFFQIFQELSRLILKSKKEARNEKDMYQKMLGQAQKLEQKTKKPINSNMSKQEPSKVQNRFEANFPQK